MLRAGLSHVWKSHVAVDFAMALEGVRSGIFSETAVSGSHPLPTQGLTVMAATMTSQMVSL